MGKYYVFMFEQNLNLKLTKFYWAMHFLFWWILLTLFRYDIFLLGSINLYLFHDSNIDILNMTIYATPNRVLIYLSKFTPIFIAIVVHSVISFFSNEAEGMESSDATSSSMYS